MSDNTTPDYSISQEHKTDNYTITLIVHLFIAAIFTATFIIALHDRANYAYHNSYKQ
jgi:hypothetical protein